MTGSHWFEELADHLGEAYLRYSFTKGSRQEVTFLVEQLGLRPGDRVLDVGCGPGRHAHLLGELGIAVHGVDISATFVDLARRDAPPNVTFERLDARALPFEGEFEAAISLCQGAFGLAAGGPSAG
ncbi:class I SAM-dependent methyltransferase, partial [Rhabdothermincola sp.]|uniref:class I SAM-dependent methyltransferase n=1 Tax=Rhabdothermincola sp. TaxID=2820405 RepID=UPI002FE233A7